MDNSKNILLIETSAALCSTAIARKDADGTISILCSRQSTTPRAHAAMTAVFIQECLQQAGISAKELSAVAVSSGPGSYTGLRVGSSSAKGICFGAGVPLLAVPTLDLIVAQAIKSNLVPADADSIVPLIDARRMEVYCAPYLRGADGTFERSGDVEPLIVDEQSFADLLERGTVLFVGDAAAKCKGVLTHSNACFESLAPLAQFMADKAFELLEAGKTEDTAYFEPFYLKEFVATVSKKSLF